MDPDPPTVTARITPAALRPPAKTGSAAGFRGRGSPPVASLRPVTPFLDPPHTYVEGTASSRTVRRNEQSTGTNRKTRTLKIGGEGSEDRSKMKRTTTTAKPKSPGRTTTTEMDRRERRARPEARQKMPRGRGTRRRGKRGPERNRGANYGRNGSEGGPGERPENGSTNRGQLTPRVLTRRATRATADTSFHARLSRNGAGGRRLRRLSADRWRE
jgi:hypothetical protein